MSEVQRVLGDIHARMYGFDWKQEFDDTEYQALLRELWDLRVLASLAAYAAGVDYMQDNYEEWHAVASNLTLGRDMYLWRDYA